MRAVKRTREVSSRLDGSVESLLAQFSATTLELNPSLGPKEFARRLTGRAAEMLSARTAVMALGHGNDWEIAAMDYHVEGILMAPARAIPRLLARNKLTFNDIAIWKAVAMSANVTVE